MYSDPVGSPQGSGGGNMSSLEKNEEKKRRQGPQGGWQIREGRH